MNKRQRCILQEIINRESTIEKIEMFRCYKDILKDIQIILFNEDASNFNGFEEKIFGKYCLCRLADYNKVWVIDNGIVDKVEFCVERRTYFDINVISRIDDYLNGKMVEDERDFIMYLNYIKNEKFGLEIGNSVIERFSKPYNGRLFKRSIESFYRYAIGEEFSRDLATVKYEEEEFEQFYEKCLDIKRISENGILNRQYDFILCLMMKAILIKADNRCQNKVDALVEFSLNVLKCIMVNEVYLLCMYLKNKQEVMKKTFAKFHSNIKGGLENAVRNSTWDIYHARMIEQQMSLYDSTSRKMIFPYFATNDKGVKDYWAINPRRMVVIAEGNAINIYEHNVGDIESMLVDKSLYNQITNPEQQVKRKKEINNVNIETIKKSLIFALNDVSI